MTAKPYYRCRHCGAHVNPAFGAEEPAAHADRDGSVTDPRAPGDHRDCCDVCCYGEEKCKHGHKDQ